MLLIFLGSCIRLSNALNTNAGLYLSLFSGFNRFQVYNDSAAVFHESAGDGLWILHNLSGPTKIVDIAQSGLNLFGVDGQTGATVWKSSDYGRTWTPVSVGSGGAYARIAGCGTNLVVIRPGISTFDGDTFYSTNGGSTWSSSSVQVNPVIGTGAGIVDLECLGGRFFISINRTTNNFLYADVPLSSWVVSAGNSGVAPSAGAFDAIGVNSSAISQYYVSTGPELHNSTNNGPNFSPVGQDFATTYPALTTSGSKIFRVRTNAGNCFTEASTIPPTLTSWTIANKTVACGTGPIITSATEGISILIGSGSSGAATSQPLVVRLDENTLMFTNETLPGTPNGKISRAVFIK